LKRIIRQNFRIKCTKYEKIYLLKILLFLGISLLFVQCLKKDEVHLSAEETAIIKIKEAKEYFEIQFLPSIDNTKTEMNQSEGKSKRHMLKKNLDWDKADTKLMENGEIGVYVPVLYDEDNYFIKGKWAWHSLSGLSYVIIYDKEKGKKSLELVTTFPDADYLSADEKPEVFSGVVYVEDWNGKFIKSIRYLNGNTFLLNELNNTKGSLLLLCSTQIDWYTCSTYGCNYNYTETVYYYCDYADGGDSYSSTDYDPATGGTTTTPADTSEDCNCDICPVCGGCLSTSFKYVPADDDTADPTENVPDCPACTCVPTVIEDTTFINSVANCVKDKLESGNILNDLIAGFDLNASKIDVTFKVEDLSGLNGKCVFNETTLQMEIIIDSDRLNASSLELANTILHESFHAYIYGKLYDPELYTGPFPEPNFVEDFKAYESKYGDNLAQHNYMAEQYITYMKQGLNDYFNTESYQSTFLNYVSDMTSWYGTDFMLECLAWSGLKETEAWSEFYIDPINKAKYDETYQSIIGLLPNENCE